MYEFDFMRFEEIFVGSLGVLGYEAYVGLSWINESVLDRSKQNKILVQINLNKNKEFSTF